MLFFVSEKKRAALWASVACALNIILTSQVLSQQTFLYPPEVSLTDKNGVDLIGGYGHFSLLEGRIGPEKSGLDYTEYWTSSSSSPTSLWSSNLYKYLDDNNLRTYIVLTIGDKSITFIKDSSSNQYSTVRGPYALLIENSGGQSFSYIEKDGSNMTFSIPPTNNPSSGFCLSSSSVGCSLFLTKIVRPDGVITTNNWDVSGVNIRNSSVENNLGYKLVFNHLYNGTNITGNLAQWHSLSAIDFFNLAYDSQKAFSVTRSRQQNDTTITTPAGQNWIIRFAAELKAIRRPGASTDSPVYTYGTPHFDYSVISVNDNGNTTTYDLNRSGSSGVMTVTNPLGDISHVYFTKWTSKTGQAAFPDKLEDELGRNTVFDVASAYLITGVTRPEGDKDAYSYDSRGNVTSIIHKSKAGSGLSDTIRTAFYPATCDNTLTCNKPSSLTDERGYTTDYTYDPTHGGVTTITLPAAGGVRPQTRYTYIQRYAWIKDTSGTYVRASTPVWLLSQESTCKTSSASGTSCSAGSSDEVRTAYDYGPDNGPNNLSLRGKINDSGGLNLRSCYSYDKYGNRISETAPDANLTSCP